MHHIYICRDQAGDACAERLHCEHSCYRGVDSGIESQSPSEIDGCSERQQRVADGEVTEVLVEIGGQLASEVRQIFLAASGLVNWD